MAKKRKRKIQKEEKYTFKIPEFNVKEYLQNELKETKITLFTLIYAIIIACFSLLLTIYVDAAVAFIVGIVALISLKYVYQFANLEIPEPDWKKWAGYGAMFFFTWLAMWILLCNPPFTDLTKPSISDMKYQTQHNGKWKDIAEKDISQGATIRIVFNVSDNDKVDISTLTIVYEGRQLKPNEINRTKFDGIYQCSFKIDKITEGTHTFIVSVKDASGNEASYTKTFYVLSS